MDLALAALLVLALTHPLPLSSAVLLSFALTWGACRFLCFLLQEHTHRVRLKDRDRLEAERPDRWDRAVCAAHRAEDARRAHGAAADAIACAADPARQAFMDWVARLPPPIPQAPPRPRLQAAQSRQSRPSARH